MIDTLRVLVDWKCNLACQYCCNDQPRFRSQIRSARLEDLDFSLYSTVCISGGEPLLFMDRVLDVAAKAQGKLLILYSNGILLDATLVAALVAAGIRAINVGLHDPRSFDALIRRGLLATADFPGVKIRFHAQDVYRFELQQRHPLVTFRFWHMDDCDRANEDRVVLASEPAIKCNFPT